MAEEVGANEPRTNGFSSDHSFLEKDILDGCEVGDSELVEALVSSNLILVNCSSEETGMTALHLACSSGNDILVALLLDHGANVHAIAMDGTTPLHATVAAGSSGVTRLLLDHGVDIDTRDAAGRSAPEMLVQPGYPKAASGPIKSLIYHARIQVSRYVCSCWLDMEAVG